ncbi:trypsin-like serine protease [Desulfopila aestuarii]|nr:trypsin-like serine protease [Desulfopila aestuarii]
MTTAISAKYDWLDGVCTLTSSSGKYATGALLYGGQYILTAAHLFDVGTSATTGADFVLDSSEYTAAFWAGGVKYELETDTAIVHGAYREDSFQHDIALVRLKTVADATISRYELYTHTDEKGQNFIKVGSGQGGDGTSGATAESDLGQRYGYNTFDATGTVFTRPGLADLASSSILAFDFDDGQSSHDFFGLNHGIVHLGLGDREANTAPGDSGGPGFINGKIASITTGGLSPALVTGYINTDVSPDTDSSFGELSLDARVSQYIDWVEGIVGKQVTAIRAGYERGVDVAYYLEEKLGQLRSIDPDTWHNKTIQDVDMALQAAGMSATDHYYLYGWQEGLNPNSYFDSEEYVVGKVRQLNSNDTLGKTDWRIEDFNAAWQLNPYEHYRSYGLIEGLNPSNRLDSSAYLTAKEAITPGYTGPEIVQAFIDSGLSVIDHYFLYGILEDIVPENVAVLGVDYSTALESGLF